MKVYILLEMGDVELTGLLVFADVETANLAFDKCLEDNKVAEWTKDHTKNAIDGTLRIASDDGYSLLPGYSLQLICRELPS